MLKQEYFTQKTETSVYIRDFHDADRFIAYCRACPNYGNRWGCPPYDFDPMDQILGFRNLYVIGVKAFPDEAMRKRALDCEAEVVREILLEIRSRLDPKLLALEQTHQGGRAFFAGSCLLCPEGACERTKAKACCLPGKVRSSLEAYGFDMGRTATEILNTELKWVKNGVLPDYFLYISGFFTNDTIENWRWE